MIPARSSRRFAELGEGGLGIAVLQFGEMMGYDKVSSGGMGQVQQNMSKLPEADILAIGPGLVEVAHGHGAKLHERIRLHAQHLHAVQLGYDTSLFSGPDLGPGWPPSYISTGNVTVTSVAGAGFITYTITFTGVAPELGDFTLAFNWIS